MLEVQELILKRTIRRPNQRYYEHMSVPGDLVWYREDLWKVRGVSIDFGRIFLALHHATDPFRLMVGEVEQSEVQPASTLEAVAVAIKNAETNS